MTCSRRTVADDPTLDRLPASKEQIEARGEILQRQTDRAIAESERSQLLLQAAKNVMEDLKGRKPSSMKHWADLVNAEAHKMGYVGRAFTEDEATFQRDTVSTLSAQSGREEKFKALERGFRRTVFDGDQCDFCDAPNVVWDYPCEDFAQDAPGDQPFHSNGPWGASDLCAQAVERNDR
jgi:hypothetical protein